MSFTRTASSLIAVLALAGCTKTIIEEVPVEVYVPVATGCLPDADKDGKGDRPAPVTPLRETITEEQWAALAPGAKAEAVRAQAGRRMNQADQLEAATSGCK